jgi:YjbR
VLSLEGASEAPHFDRAAFRVARTFATLAADRQTANLKFTPDEQALKCEVAADAFSPILNAWGAQGWTVARLSNLTVKELDAAIRLAFAHAQPKPPRRKRPA